MNPNSRRKFITDTSLALTGICLGAVPVLNACSDKGKKKEKAKWDGKKNKPRFVAKKTKKIPEHPWHKAEAAAIQQLQKADVSNASNILFAEISGEKAKKRVHHQHRLYDMLILLCRRDQSIHDTLYDKTVALALNSGDKQLAAKAGFWQKASEKKLKKQHTRKHWDKQLI